MFNSLDEEDGSTAQRKCPTCRSKGTVAPADDDDVELMFKTGRDLPCSNCGGSGSVDKYPGMRGRL